MQHIIPKPLTKREVIDIVSKNGAELGNFSPATFEDRDIVMAAVKNMGIALMFAAPRLKKDREIVLTAMQNNGGSVFGDIDIDPAFYDDKAIVIAALSSSGTHLSHASARLKNDLQVVLTAVKQDGEALNHASTDMKINQEVVLAAVTQKGSALAYAHPSMADNEQIVSAAVKNDSRMVFHASARLKKNKNILALRVAQAIPQPSQFKLRTDPEPTSENVVPIKPNPKKPIQPKS